MKSASSRSLPSSWGDPAQRVFQALREELAAKCSFLKDKPHENADNTLRALWFAVAGQPCAIRRLDHKPLPALNGECLSRLNELVGRRLAGVPLAHLTNREEFMGLELIAGPEALIPRPETELVASLALDAVRETLKDSPTAKVIDICSGSGNIALALAYHEPRCRIAASDISEEAIALARRNASYLKLEDRVAFHVGDLFAPFQPTPENRVDLIVANPPYISSQRLHTMPDEIAAHEPRAAFDGGPLGISVLARIIVDAPRFLKPGKWMCMEVGLGQAKGVASMLTRNGRYVEVQVAQDESGAERAVMARVASTAVLDSPLA